MNVVREGSQAIAVRGLLTDITDERKAADELRVKAEQLQQAQKMEAIGRLAGGVAHDFNNLLTAILGYTGMLLVALDGHETAKADVEEIRTAAESAASLTKQLLAFSRRQILQPRVLDLNEIVSRVEALLQRTIGEDVTLVKRLDAQLGMISADPGQIEQIILNLAVNARDAMPNGGQLIVETENVTITDPYMARHPGTAPGPHVMLAVTDTGIGMTNDVQSHVFEPFFTTKEPGRGTGLGLATVYGIVKQSGGTIWVYSEPGRGTTFKIFLPTVAHRIDQVPVPHISAPRGGSETILLVEDQPAVRAIVRKALTSHGYTVLDASHGDDALKAIAEHTGPLDLLLTDVVMPRMSGSEVTERIRATHPGVRVLYMSGYTEEAVIRNGVLGSVVPFLEKPFTPDVVLRKVREVLDAAPSA